MVYNRSIDSCRYISEGGGSSIMLAQDWVFMIGCCADCRLSLGHALPFVFSSLACHCAFVCTLAAFTASSDYPFVPGHFNPWFVFRLPVFHASQYPALHSLPTTTLCVVASHLAAGACRSTAFFRPASPHRTRSSMPISRHYSSFLPVFAFTPRLPTLRSCMC